MIQLDVFEVIELAEREDTCVDCPDPAMCAAWGCARDTETPSVLWDEVDEDE